MDSNALVQGVIYDSAEYGPVQFSKTVPDQNMARGVCHKFKILNGHHVYIRPGELKAFFRREE